MTFNKTPADMHMFEQAIDVASYDPDVVERAAEQDRIWFDHRPHRSYRARRLIEGEFPKLSRYDSTPPNFTIVRQISPGHRQRFPISLYVVIRYGSGQLIYSIDGPKNEEDVRQLWEELVVGGGND